jgi:hypothetical protein
LCAFLIIPMRGRSNISRSYSFYLITVPLVMQLFPTPAAFYMLQTCANSLEMRLRLSKSAISK